MPKIPNIFRFSETIGKGLTDAALVVAEKTGVKNKVLENFLPAVVSLYSIHCLDKKTLVSPFEIYNNLTF